MHLVCYCPGWEGAVGHTHMHKPNRICTASWYKASWEAVTSEYAVTFVIAIFRTDRPADNRPAEDSRGCELLQQHLAVATKEHAVALQHAMHMKTAKLTVQLMTAGLRAAAAPLGGGHQRVRGGFPVARVGRAAGPGQPVGLRRRRRRRR